MPSAHSASRRDAAKVLDFGLAKLTPKRTGAGEAVGLSSLPTARTGDELVSTPGVAMGTVTYMSPEQARGEEVDARTDLFSFGAVLYEMATGRQAFSGNSAGMIFNAILEKAPISPLRVNPNLPAGLEPIIIKALEKDRRLRCQSAAELLADLRRLKRDLESGRVAKPGAAAAPATRSQTAYALAVLPFISMSDHPDTEFLSDGITESLINNLSQLPKLRVAPRSLVFRYKGKEVEPEVAGREINARTILAGRVFQRGDTLNIRAELLDTAQFVQLWGQQYTRKVSDIFELQEEIATEISEKLRVKLTGEDKKRLAKKPTQNTEAYQAYLRGRYYWEKRTVDGFKKAVTHFEQAIEKDPAYALAYSGLADAYTFLGTTMYGALPPREAMPKAKAAALKAVEIDDKLAEAHVAVAHICRYYDWDSLAAEQAYRRAVELKPNSATAHHSYGIHLSAMGRFDDAIAEMKLAQELDPLSLVINANVAWLLYQARQYDLAIQQGRKVIELDSNFFLGHARLAAPLAQKGMYVEAIAEFQKAVGLSGRAPYWLAGLGHTYGLSGKREEAQKLLDEFKKLLQQHYVSPFDIAVIYIGLDEKDQAFEWLEKAFQERAGWLTWLKVEPIFDNLRSDPRFTDLLRRVGLS